MKTVEFEKALDHYLTEPPQEPPIRQYSYTGKEIYQGEEYYQDDGNHCLLFEEIDAFLSNRKLKTMAEMIVELDDEPYKQAREALLEIIKDNYTDEQILEWFNFEKVVAE